MSVPAWVIQWVQARDDALLYATEDARPGGDSWPAPEIPASRVLRAQRGVRMVRHAIIVPLSLACEARMEDAAEVCETAYPAQRCVCGQYWIRWE